MADERTVPMTGADSGRGSTTVDIRSVLGP
jgi:hypothetical protein